MERVLVDAGPLVALVSARDEHHAWCVEQWHKLRPPLLTTWAVVAEAAWLVRHDSKAHRVLFELGEARFYSLPQLDEAALPWLRRFLTKYLDVHAQLADATLVYLAERENVDTVFTLDRRDFSIYRFGRNQAFRIYPEE